MTQCSLRIQDYTVGWVCALPIELAAATEMLDEEYQNVPQDGNDTNLYTLGRIGEHQLCGRSRNPNAVEVFVAPVQPNGRHRRRGPKRRVRHTTW
jgi:hypothetical protein